MVRKVLALWLVIGLAAQAKARTMQTLRERRARVEKRGLVELNQGGVVNAPKSAYRCSNCNLNWPLQQEYRTCPECKMACWVHKVDPDTIVSSDEALSRQRHIAFEKYCEEHDQRVMQEHVDALSGNDVLYPDAILGG